MLWAAVVYLVFFVALGEQWLPLTKIRNFEKKLPLCFEFPFICLINLKFLEGRKSVFWYGNENQQMHTSL
jgi:hypothetical protein